MKVHVRFRQGLDAYPKGSSHYLPDDLADHYIRAGVAELVDVVPRPAVETEEKTKPPVDDSAKQDSSAADDDTAETSEAEDDATTKTTSGKRRKS